MTARRLDALLDLVTGDRHGEPAILVVYLRLDDPDQPVPAAEASTPAVPNPACTSK